MGTLIDYIRKHSEPAPAPTEKHKSCPTCSWFLDSDGKCSSCGPSEPVPTPVASRLADALAKAKTLKKGGGGAYIVIDGGADARLEFGRFRGKLISQIAVLDKSYLAWMTTKRDGVPMFTDELIAIIKRWI